MSKSSIARRADLTTALKRFRKGEHISLEDLALLRGVSKARFVNLRGEIVGFPEPIGKQGNALLYDARPAIQALLDHEGRNDSRANARSAKVAKILGASHRGDDDEVLPASELLAMARTQAEIEKRKREQGQLVLFDEVQKIAGNVFTHLSKTLGKLSDSVDPNGKLPPAPRQLLDGLGTDLLLRMYKELSDMLGGNADPDPRRATPPRVRTDGARKPRVRRKAA